MTHKFKVGDKVKVVQSGCGCSYLDEGKITVITGLREDYMEDDPGYDVKDLENGELPIGESSFELVDDNSQIDKLKAEIADKQRELQALYDAEKEDKYHFKGEISWPEFADKLKEIDNGAHYIGEVQYVDGTLKFDLGMRALLDVDFEGKKLFNYKKED